MSLRQLIITFLLISSIRGTAQNREAYTISGRIEGVGNAKVMLGNKPKGGHSGAFKVRYIDSCFSTNDHFVFKGHADELAFYSIEVPGVVRGWAGFIIENKEIQIAGHKDSINRSKVTGSSQNDIYDHYREAVYLPLARKAETIHNEIFRLRKLNDTIEAKRLEKEVIDPYYKEMAANRYRFIEENPSNFGALFELSNIPEEEDSVKKYYAVLSAELKESTLGKKLKYKLFEYPELIRLKKPMPSFSMPDTANHERSLSEFRGKYVLIDLWASWCAPCLEELPVVKRIDSLYRSKGLQVVGISMDTKKKLWTASIINNKIPWINLSDLEGSDNKAALLLNVNAIPAKFLLDPDGNILLMNASLSEIEKFLSNTLSN